MSDSVDRRNQNATLVTANQMLVTRFPLPQENKLRHPILHQRHVYCFHFFTVTIVPRPGFEVISNSSISRRTPGNPSPRLPEVENPSRRACGMSLIPGPLSDAMIKTPCPLVAWPIFTVISPLPASDPMLRASFFIALATTAAS